MPITSYAQNFEDIMLWRALGHIQNGFYIDIGAQDPIIDSVSKAFYEKGWRGIHVEATQYYVGLLHKDRPDESVLQAAVSNRNGTITFYEIPETGISTGDQSIAQEHKVNGFEIKEIIVPCITLADIFEQLDVKEVHWLKIDVEGMEKQVIEGWLPSEVLPWIVVIESTFPLSQIETSNAWEQSILRLGYKFAYFDGLNRFYVSSVHSELLRFFSTPPNFFDGFRFSDSSCYCSYIKNEFTCREDIIKQQQGEINQLNEKKLNQCEQQLEIIRVELNVTALENQNIKMEMAEKTTTHYKKIISLRESQTKMRQLINELREREFIVKEERAENERNLLLKLLDKESYIKNIEHTHYECVIDLNNQIAQIKYELVDLRTDLIRSENKNDYQTKQLDNVEKLRNTEQDELNAERESNKYLRQLLMDLQLEIKLIKNSFFWRFLSFLRKIIPYHYSTDTKSASTTSNSYTCLPSTSPYETNGLTNSIISRQRGTHEENEMNDVSKNTVTIDNKLKVLLQFQDRKFVENAYQILFMRQPDSDGLNYYLNRLRDGVPKIHILGQLFNSNEVLLNKNEYRILRKAIRQYKMTSIPFLGRFFKYFFVTESNSTFESRLRSIEQHMYRIDDQSEMNFIRIQQSLNDLNNSIEHLIKTSAHLTVNGNSVNSQNLQNTHNKLETTSDTSTGANNVYVKLKAAIIKNAGGIE